ncbi:nitroreductase family protein [soil metagenome]
MTGYVYPRPEDEARYSFEPYRWIPLPPTEQLTRGRAFRDRMATRRSIRTFSHQPVPRELIELAVATAATAPSGAHQQPWTFAITDDPEVKHRIRLAAEAEEQQNYDGGRMGEEWTTQLARLGTHPDKGYLEDAPWLLVAFAQRYGIAADGRHVKHYYVTESVGIACGLLIAALHEMGLATLSHTPSPMGFLRDIFGRPANEKPMVLFPIGYPAEGSKVPVLGRKSLAEVLVEAPTPADRG